LFSSGAYIINTEEEVLVTESGSEYLTPHQDGAHPDPLGKER
jgi:hypothetical protein